MEVKGKTVRMSVISYKKIFRRYDIIFSLRKKMQRLTKLIRLVTMYLTDDERKGYGAGRT